MRQRRTGNPSRGSDWLIDGLLVVRIMIVCAKNKQRSVCRLFCCMAYGESDK